MAKAAVVEKPQETSETPRKVVEPAMTKDYLLFLAENVKELDAQLSQASGQGAAAKKAIREKIAGEVKNEATRIISVAEESFSNVEDRVLVGVLSLLDDLTAKLKERADKVISDEQGKMKGAGGADVEGLKDKKKKAVTAFNSLKNLLEGTMDMDVSDVSIPTRGGGKRGTGTTRTRTKGFDFYIDGKLMSDKQNSLSGAAFYATKGGSGTIKEAEGQQSAYLKGLLKAKGISENSKEWPDEWTITLPNGKKVAAKRRPPEPQAEGDVEVEAAAEVPA